MRGIHELYYYWQFASISFAEFATEFVAVLCKLIKFKLYLLSFVIFIKIMD